MPLVSLPYWFQQPFRVPAKVAFAWCVDFRAADTRLFPLPVRRTVRRLSDDALVLTDVTHPDGRRRRIRRLVRIVPDQLAWTNTHLDGPFQGSQFWYRVVPVGTRRSRLEFTGLRLETRSSDPSAAQRRRAAEALRGEDATLWRDHLAPALEQDCNGRTDSVK
jgi:hypothetical protein